VVAAAPGAMVKAAGTGNKRKLPGVYVVIAEHSKEEIYASNV
jgi:hypothetical protein